MNNLNASLPRTLTLDLIIPTHNRSELLKKCLDSVIKAIAPKRLLIRVLVVDNNSTDNTKEVVEGYHRFCEYLFVGSPGKSAALNAALEATTGDIVGFIDDDEQIDKQWFEIIYREFSSDDSPDFIGGPYIGDWEGHRPVWLPNEYSGAIGIALRSHRDIFTKEYSGMLMGGNAIIRRSILERVLPYPEQLGKIGKKIRSGEDEVIYHRLLALDAKGYVVPELIIHHWIPAARTTKKYYRKWVIGRGISVGSQLRERGFSEAKIFGLPRYKLGKALKSFIRMFSARSRQVRFTSQLDILDYFATLYGFHFYK